VQAAAQRYGEFSYRIMPAAVLLAFTIEVGLKALLMKARGDDLPLVIRANHSWKAARLGTG